MPHCFDRLYSMIDIAPENVRTERTEVVSDLTHYKAAPRRGSYVVVR